MDIVEEMIEQEAMFDAEFDWLVRDYQRLKKLLGQRDALIARQRAQLGDAAEPDYLEYSFEELERRAKAALQMGHGWQTVFEQQSGNSHSVVEQWKAAGVVPAEAISACETLSPVARRKKIPWGTRPELTEAIKGLQGELTHVEIALRMSETYPDYEWTANTIAGRVNSAGLTLKPRKAKLAAQPSATIHQLYKKAR